LAALDCVEPAVAMSVVEAFVNAVTAQAGHRIDAEHAAHMVMHGEMVIESLEGEARKVLCDRSMPVDGICTGPRR
jgi:hypothetical protein